MQQNNTPVFVCLYYDEKVLVFDEQDYTNGKYLLDYNSNVGKQFAAKNKIEFDEYDIDYKQKINHLREKIVLPETTSAEKVRKFGEPNPKKTEKKIKSDRNPDAKEGTEADKSETKQSEDNAKAQKPDEVENEDEDTVSDISEPAISPDKAISETSGKKNVLTKKKR